jgi:tetratricopeptide (TPR) repeat protein
MKRALLILLIAAPALGQSWYDAYNRGVAAVRAKNYPAAAEALQAAIREMPSESAKLRANREFITYLPHMWLGIARAGMNDPDAALAEFRISEEQGVVQGTTFYAQMKDWAARAQQQKKDAAQNAAAGSRREANSAIGRAVAAQSDALTAGGEHSDAYRNAQRKLQEALDAFNHAGTDVRAYGRARDVAVQARELFAGATEEARKKKPPPKEIEIPFDDTPPKKVVITNTTGAGVTPSVSEGPGGAGGAQQPPDRTAHPPRPLAPARGDNTTPPSQPVVQPQPQPQSESLVAARIAVQGYKRKLIEARQPVAGAINFERVLAGTPDEKTIARVRSQVAEQERRLEEQLKPKPAEPPPPAVVATAAPPPVAVDTRPELEAAYRAFAGGDYAASETLLTNAIAKSATAEAFALRGCTRFTRAMLSRTPETLLPSAAADFREALRLNAALRLGGGAFSPKLVAFFESVRKGQ